MLKAHFIHAGCSHRLFTPLLRQLFALDLRPDGAAFARKPVAAQRVWTTRCTMHPGFAIRRRRAQRLD
ncbi:hypothetical protein [Lysobacter sp. CA196]|uniref:hypothetical protein n=1 Tax=Lysobacter sp. CA196 TaxID=3455606 RepID=UPI003F8D7C6E